MIAAPIRSQSSTRPVWVLNRVSGNMSWRLTFTPELTRGLGGLFHQIRWTHHRHCGERCHFSLSMAEGTNRGSPRISSGNKDHLDGYEDQACDCLSCYHLQGNGETIACVPGAWKRTIDLQYRVIGRVCSSSTLQFRHSASHQCCCH